MTKEQTQQLKGVAILMMIWGHLFGSGGHVLSAYNPLLFVGEEPLVTIISRATGPVAFFLLLSGYGLYYSNKTGDKHRYSRIARLLITYWIVLLLVVCVGNVICPGRYFCSWSEFILNVIGLDPSYIPEAWFMLPYILLSLSAPFEFRLLRVIRSRYILLFAFSLNILTSFVLSRYGASILYPNRLLYVLFCWFHFQFSFLAGMCMARMNLSPMDILKKPYVTTLSQRLKAKPRAVTVAALILLVALRCMMRTSVLHSVYVCVFVLLWICLDLPVWLDTLLRELGRRSTSMWFVHTSIGLYLFADWFNALSNPILVFVSVTFSSWIVACGVDFIRNKLP